MAVAHPLARLEITFNRIFAVLLVLTTLPLLLNIWTIPTIVLFGIFAMFLFFSKNHHVFTNIVFLIFASGVYLVPLPIGWGVYHSLKQIRLSGFDVLAMSALFNVCTIIFVTFAARNILGNIQAFFKPSITSRNLFYLISLATVFTTLVAFPLFDNVNLRERAFEDDAGGGKLSFVLTKQELNCGGISGCSSSALWRDYTARFDSTTSRYVYRLNLKDPLTESIVFTAVETDGKNIDFISDSRVTCLNCQMDMGSPHGLVFPAGRSIDFIISSGQFIKNIKFTEQGGNVDDFFFWR
jgi:hypothetical protein